MLAHGNQRPTQPSRNRNNTEREQQLPGEDRSRGKPRDHNGSTGEHAARDTPRVAEMDYIYAIRGFELRPWQQHHVRRNKYDDRPDQRVSRVTPEYGSGRDDDAEASGGSVVACDAFVLRPAGQSKAKCA